MSQGTTKLAAALPGILEDVGDGHSDRMRAMVASRVVEWEELDRREAELNGEVARECKGNEACRRLDEIAGIGPLIATAPVGAAGDGAAFERARDFTAWLGLTPREDATGGKRRLGRPQQG